MIKIIGVTSGSYADKAGIKEGDMLVSINGNVLRDVLDYRFYMCEKKLKIELCRDGNAVCVSIKKGEYDDIGLEFETFLMDEKHSCRNACVFCFIDQLPKGMRDTLYFKDDDSRLSFLMGNYVTLTNLKDEDVDRIIKMRMTPINISVHTTDKDLRVKMLRNKRAGEVLDYMKKFADAGIEMNCQIVLCKGLNDKEKLDETMHDLASLYPSVPSVSIVPCGMTKFRDGLYPLEPFTKEESRDVVRQVESFAAKCREHYGESIFYCGDELYIEGGLEIPNGEYYGEYRQIENGVGMMASMSDELDSALEDAEYEGGARKVSVATGAIAYEYIKKLCGKISERFHEVKINVYKIENDFFGHSVTVAGLVTGTDIMKELEGKDLGEKLFIPSCMLRHGGDLFLCGASLAEVSEKLGVPIVTVDNDGYEFLDKIIGG